MLERLKAALADRYRVEGELGEGGMALVYLAEDLKHGRKVALKILKPELAAVVGAERFLAEIRTTASLQHPNILPLFDSGEAAGSLYYVMPYVEGESLRELLDREVQLGVEAAVRIARTVAAALRTAHDAGVIHRDIKPENILFSRGEPVVADFGIALAVSQAGGGRLTETGLSVGTPYYMSPEQAAADREPGRAADIYSLGCVLYEMLVGEPPFTGVSAQAVLAKILTEHPRPVTAVRRTVPPNVADAVARALERLPADRFETVDDFARALADPGFRHRVAPAGSAAGATAGAGSTGAARGSAAGGDGHTRRRSSVAVVGSVALVSLLAGGALSRALAPTAAPERSFRAAVALPEGQTVIDPPFGSSISLSDDGETLLYAGVDAESGLWQFWTRRAGELNSTPVRGTAGGFTPVLSPSGDGVAFVTQEAELVVIGLSSGARQVLADEGNFVVDWSDDGYIYFTDNVPNFFRVPADGGEVEPLPGLAPEGSVRWTFGEPLPGGTHGVWTRHPSSWNLADATVGVVDLQTGDFSEVARGGSPRYLKSGHLTWTTQDGVLQVAPFDVEAGQLTGRPSQLADGVRIDNTGAAFVAFSERGDVVYRTGDALAGGLQPTWIDESGAAVPVDPEWWVLPAASGNWSGLALSPSGDRIVTTDGTGGGSQLWVKDLAAGAPPSRITFEGDFHVRPRWSATGDTVLYISAPSGVNDVGGAPLEPTGVWARAADGSGAPRELLSLDVEIEEALMAPDGQWLIYRQGGTTAGRDIYARRLDGGGGPIAVAATEADEKSPQLSSDGRWVAYVSDVTGLPEVFVRPFPDVSGGVWQISQGGGTSPVWDRDTTVLHYLNNQGGLSLLSARLEVDGNAIRVAGRETLFSISNQYVDPNYLSFDTGPDDTFVFYSFERQDDGELVWYRNWLAALPARSGPPQAP